MARQDNNVSQAWANFQASGSVADYLRYRRLENRADKTANQVSGVSNAKRGTNAARGGDQGKRPPDHGAY